MKFTKKQLSDEDFIQLVLVPRIVSSMWQHASAQGHEDMTEVSFNFGYLLSLTMHMAAHTISDSFPKGEAQTAAKKVFYEGTLSLLKAEIDDRGIRLVTEEKK